jgi:mannose-6-phosphate isomerase
MFESVDKPWGKYFVLDDSETHKVKKILVEPQGKLSYQYHQHRSEIWVVVKGKATVTIEDEVKVYLPGQIISIPEKTKHRVENLEGESLVFIEVQLGSYFGEDDIVRLHDIYNRK